MTAKQRRLKREKEIALNSWYSCMIAMGSLPKDEDLYFKAKKQFMDKYRIGKNENIRITCDDELSHIKDAYLNAP